MRSWLIIGALLVFAGPLWAQTAKIRSGEHDTFTRLVITIPLDTEWSAEKHVDGFKIVLDRVEQADFAGVFERIPRSRITTLSWSSEQNTILIGSDCECIVNAFLWRPSRLVVDIKDSKEALSPDLEATLSLPAEDLVLPIIVENQQEAAGLIPVSSSSELENEIELNKLSELVTDGLARGTSQGLLQVNNEVESLVGQAIESHFMRNGTGLQARTSIDGLVHKNDRGNASPADNCLQKDSYDIASWGSSKPFGAHIAELRGTLTHEFDDLDVRALEDLAKGLLYYGFGKESQVLLGADGINSQSQNTLLEISRLIEGEPTAGMFGHLSDCSDAALFWASLDSSISVPRTSGRNGALLYFRSLPVHLRRHLGPQLTLNLIAAGDLDAAELVSNPEIGVEDLPIRAGIVETKLQQERGEISEAGRALETLAKENSRMTPEALTDYFNIMRETDSSVDPETLELANILRFELRGSGKTADLAEAQIFALLQSRNAKRAFEVFDEDIDSLFDNGNDLIGEIFLVAIEEFDNRRFIDLLFTNRIMNATPKAQNAAATRLLNLGLPERASEIVKESTVGTAMIERRHIRARAALDMGDPNEALLQLSGQTSPMANTIRKSAELLINGNEQLANSQRITDWRLGNWATLAQGPDVLMQEVATSVLRPRIQISDADAPLGEGRLLLSQSAKSRSLIENVLERFPSITE